MTNFFPFVLFDVLLIIMYYAASPCHSLQVCRILILRGYELFASLSETESWK